MKWKTVSLADCIRDVQSRDPRTEPSREFCYVDISSVDNVRKKITESKRLKGKDAPSRARKVIHANDVLVATTRPNLNAVALVASELDRQICSTGFCILRSNDQINPDYLFCFVQSESFVKELTELVQGALYPAVTDSQVLSRKIPLPPLTEQHRIAARLREQLAEVEKARTALLGQLDAAEKLSAGQLTHLFGGDAFQQWPHKPFESVAVLQRGHDLPARERTEGIHPVVTSAGIVGTHGEFIAKAPGVVTGRSGSIGKVHFIEKDYWPHNTALYVKNFRGNEPRYVYYLMKWVGVRDVSSGTGVPTLDRKEVHKLEVPCPPANVQRRLVAQLDAMQQPTQDLITQIKTRLKATEKLPAALLRDFFAAAP